MHIDPSSTKRPVNTKSAEAALTATEGPAGAEGRLSKSGHCQAEETQFWGEENRKS